jgi:hypothetical protein
MTQDAEKKQPQKHNTTQKSKKMTNTDPSKLRGSQGAAEG